MCKECLIYMLVVVILMGVFDCIERIVKEKIRWKEIMKDEDFKKAFIEFVDKTE